MTTKDKSGALPRRSLLLACLALSCGATWADGHTFNVANDTFQSECGSCHVAYPPALLPASSWQRMMSTLDKHFGVDASLDAESARDIGEFLARNAASGRRAERVGDTLRISETGWFRREHEEDLSPAAWKNPKVKSAANCGACHSQAERGEYGERGLRVPRD